MTLIYKYAMEDLESKVDRPERIDLNKVLKHSLIGGGIGIPLGIAGVTIASLIYENDSSPQTLTGPVIAGALNGGYLGFLIGGLISLTKEAYISSKANLNMLCNHYRNSA